MENKSRQSSSGRKSKEDSKRNSNSNSSISQEACRNPICQQNIKQLQMELSKGEEEIKTIKAENHRLDIEVEDLKSRCLPPERSRKICEENQLLKTRINALQEKYDLLLLAERQDSTFKKSILKILKEDPEKYAILIDAVITVAKEGNELRESQMIPAPRKIGVNYAKNQKRKNKRKLARDQSRSSMHAELQGIKYKIPKLDPKNETDQATSSTMHINDPRGHQKESVQIPIELPESEGKSVLAAARNKEYEVDLDLVDTSTEIGLGMKTHQQVKKKSLEDSTKEMIQIDLT